jgi:hypothetical protein
MATNEKGRPQTTKRAKENLRPESAPRWIPCDDPSFEIELAYTPFGEIVEYDLGVIRKNAPPDFESGREALHHALLDDDYALFGPVFDHGRLDDDLAPVVTAAQDLGSEAIKDTFEQLKQVVEATLRARTGADEEAQQILFQMTAKSLELPNAVASKAGEKLLLLYRAGSNRDHARSRANEPPPGFRRLYSPRAPKRFERALAAAERACKLKGESVGPVREGIIDILYQSKVSTWVWDSESAPDRATKNRRQQQSARERKPEIKKRFRWAWRKAGSEEMTEDEKARVDRAFSDYLRVRNDIKGRHKFAERMADRRRRLFYGDPTARLSLDNPTHSTVLTDFILVPIWHEIEGSGRHLSSRRVAKLVYEIVASFLPLQLARELNANAIRVRVDRALIRELTDTES